MTNQHPTPDLAPEDVTLEDGGPQQAAPANPEPDAGQQDDSEDGGQPKFFVDGKRAAIMAKARDLRSAQMHSEFDGNVNGTALNNGTGDMGDIEREALARAKTANQQDIAAATGQQQPQDVTLPAPQQGELMGYDPEFLAKTVTTKVNGRTVTKTIEDLIRDSQRVEAADQNLAFAKGILTAAKQFSSAAQNQGDAGSEPDGRDNSQPAGHESSEDGGDTSRDPKEMARALAEKIQLGSTDEATEALASIIEMAQSPRGQEIDQAAVLQVLEDRASAEALTKYVTANPELASDEKIVNLTASEIQKFMAQDLLNAGLTRQWLTENVRSAADLTRLHREARIARAPNVRSVADLTKAAYDSVIQWRGGRQQQQQQRPAYQPDASLQQTRQDRKASLTHQPAPRGNAQLPASQQERTQEQSRQDRFAAMMKARGRAV